ncbi:MAG: metallophosphoesterase [Candidatus Babeliales bacterium]
MKLINRRLLPLIATTLTITNIHLLHAQQPKQPSSPAQKTILFATQKIVAQAERQTPKTATPDFIKNIFEAQRDETIRAWLRKIARSGNANGFEAVFTEVLGKKPSELPPSEVLRYLKIKDKEKNISALESAAANVNFEFIKLVFKSCDSAVTPEDKNEILKQAAGRDHNNDQQDECITFLIEKGADIQSIITYFTAQLGGDQFEIIPAFRIANVARRLNKQYDLVKNESLADWANNPGRARALAQATVDKTTPIDPSIVQLFAALDAAQQKSPTTFGNDALKIHVQKGAQICCMGDIHGSLGALIRNLQKLRGIGFLDANFKIKEGQNKPQNYMVFTGDYMSRGKHKMGVIYTLLLLIAANPGRIFLTRGNHEDPAIAEQTGTGYNNIEELETIYGSNYASVWNFINKNFFSKLTLVVFFEIPGTPSKFLQCCHGGVDPAWPQQEFLKSAENSKENIFGTLNYKNANDALKPISNFREIWPDGGQHNKIFEAYQTHMRSALISQQGPLVASLNNGCIWSEFNDGTTDTKYNPTPTSIDEFSVTVKFPAGIKTGSHIAGKVANALGILGWIRGHQHDRFGLKIGGETNWRDCLQGKATLDATTQLLAFKFADAKLKDVFCPVFTLSTASESEGLDEPYDSFIILDTTEDNHDDWVIKVHEAKVPADSPFWAPATTRNAAALKSVTAEEKKSVEAAIKQADEDFELAKKIRMIAGDGNAEKDVESVEDFKKAVDKLDPTRVARCIDMLLEKDGKGNISQASNGVSAISSAIAHNKPKLTAAFLGYPLAELTKNLALAQCIASDFSLGTIQMLIQQGASILSAISYRLHDAEKYPYLHDFCIKIKFTGQDVIIDGTQKEPQASSQIVSELAQAIRAIKDDDEDKDDTMIRLLAEKHVDGLTMIKELSTDTKTQSFCEKIIKLGGHIGIKEKKAASAQAPAAAPATVAAKG